MAIATLQTKWCPKCETELPIEEFHKNQKAKDGLQSRCKECAARYNEEYYVENQGRILQQVTKRRKNNRDEINRKLREYFNTLNGRLARIFGHLNLRCNSPAVHNYKNYGGRGIENRFTLDEFRNYVVNELGITTIEQIQGLQIDRIDNDGHYEKGNIRFVTCKENNNNRRFK